MKKRDGFTLIEMMITVGIVGLLATLATWAVITVHQRALHKQAETELHILANAVLQLAWDTGKWPNGAPRNNPGSDEVWDLSKDSAGLLGNNGSFDNWKGPYYEGSLRDPWWKSSERQRVYFFDPDYRINGVNHVVVGSFGPNGVGPNKYDSDDVYVLLDD